MTAEVIILNSSGVALAADSAVTIGGTKIYNTAIKLLALSKTEPVGIMIYGNAGLMGVPWEILIKVYRTQLKNKKMDKLEDYGEDFLDFLRNRSDLFPSEVERQWVGSNVYRYYTFLRETLVKKVQPIIESGTPVGESEVAKAFEELIDEKHKLLSDQPYISDMDKAFEAEAREHYDELFRELLESTFQNLKPKRGYVTKLYDIAIYLHTRVAFSRGSSGLVIAGYGDAEIYPSVLSYELEGILRGKLKYQVLKDKSKKITKSSDAAIYPYAQEDMVNLFMNGVNSQILMYLQTALSGMVERVPDLIKDEDLNTETRSAEEIKDEIGLSYRALLGSFYQDFGKHIRDSHISPVMSMVRVLPKDELAAMAEALVNLTAFKRKMTNTLETVGGPIDVAVISKGDGLVWVKRKHYFPRELNANFYQNYFRGIDDDK